MESWSDEKDVFIAEYSSFFRKREVVQISNKLKSTDVTMETFPYQKLHKKSGYRSSIVLFMSMIVLQTGY